MSRRKSGKRRSSSKKHDPILFIVLSGIIIMFFQIISKLILILFNYIIYLKSGYKDKTKTGFLKMYFDRGLYGEFKFYTSLIKHISKDNVLLNLYLPNINTEFTEIDIVGITTKGVYVFEVKNYRGWIYGSENQQYWTQVFNKNSKFKFYNPVRQNYAHTKAIESFLEIDNDKIIPIISFSDQCRLKKIDIKENTIIYNNHKALKFVRHLEKNRVDILTESEVSKYLELLSTRIHATKEVKEKHILDVEELVNK